jgi:hypothetical protein
MTSCGDTSDGKKTNKPFLCPFLMEKSIDCFPLPLLVSEIKLTERAKKHQFPNFERFYFSSYFNADIRQTV